MLSEREVGIELGHVVSKMIDKKLKKEHDKESNLLFGCAYGLLIALDKAEGLNGVGANDMLKYIADVLYEIFQSQPEDMELIAKFQFR